MSLRHTGAADAWGAHLGEDLVKPLQRPIQVQLDPAGGAGHGLSPARHWERGGLGDVKHVQKHTHVRMPFPALVTGFFPEPEIRTALLDPVLEEMPLTC